MVSEHKKKNRRGFCHIVSLEWHIVKIHTSQHTVIHDMKRVLKENNSVLWEIRGLSGVKEGHSEEVTFKPRNQNVNSSYLSLLLGHLEFFLRTKRDFWMIFRS